MKSKRQSGSALVAAIILVVIASGIVSVAVAISGQTAQNSARIRHRESAIAVSDAYLETAFAQWRSVCRKQSNRPPKGSDFSSLTPPPGSVLQENGEPTVSNFRIRALEGINSGPQKQNEWGNDAPIAAQQGFDAADNSYLYLASADVTLPAAGGAPLQIKARRIFEKRIESPWKYAIFYDRLLEIHPGPAFLVKGWVHSNGDIYAITGGGNSLTFGDRVTYAGDYLETFVDGDAQRRGYTGPDDTKIDGIQKPIYNTDIPHAPDTRKDPFGMDPAMFNTSDTNPNNDSYRELIERPDPAHDDPLSAENSDNPRFYDQAGVKIIVDNETLTVMDLDGNVMSPTSSTKKERDFYNAVASAVTTGQSIQDNREQSQVGLTTLDVGLINQNLQKIGTWNGVVFIADQGADPSGGTPKRGVRVRNGAALPGGGLTITSENPVYVQGDFNTATSWEPAAFAADAVNILSNAWTDANSSANLSSRKASNTIINAAILSGIVPTEKNEDAPAKSIYSGGVENFPRFLEDWGSATLTYNGSMVQIFQSEQSIGNWGKGNVYSPPKRDWSFEPRFRRTPPPGIFLVTSYTRGRWFLE